MRVKLKGDLSGTRNGQSWPARGEEMDLPDDEGAELCAIGMAEPVAVVVKAETRPAKGKSETRDSD